MEYVHSHLLDMPGLRAHVGKSHDSMRSHQSIKQEVNAIVALHKAEMWDPINPMYLGRPERDKLQDPTYVILTTGPWAETDYVMGPKTHLVAQLLDAIHTLREQDSIDNFEEKAFRTNLVTLNETEYYNSVKACWHDDHPNVHNAMCTALGMTWGVGTLLRGDSQQVS